MWYGVNKGMFNACLYLVVSGGTISGNSDGITGCTNLVVSGGVFSGNSNGISSCSNSVVSGGVFSGNSNGISSCSAATISGGTISGNGGGIINCSNSVVSGGTISGNGGGITGCSNLVVSGGTISGNGGGITGCSNSVVSGGTFNGNNYDIANTTGNLFGVELTAAIEHYQYTNITNGWHSLQSDNHDAVEGAVKAWCKGGVVTSQTAIKPDGYTQACAHALESATYPAFWYKKFTVPAGQTYSIEVQLRKSASMAYLPRVYLMASIGNPLAGATPVDTFTMTNSIDTWESDTFTIDNSAGTTDKDYTLWFVAKNASGNVYSAYDITTQGGGTSSVKILPFTGKVGL